MSTAIVVPQVLDLNFIQGSKMKVQLELAPELTLLSPREQPSPGCHTFRILHQDHGDQRVTWRSQVLAEINAAKELFLELVKKGLTPYKVSGTGKKTTEVMRVFDAMAEEVVFVPVAVVRGG